MSFIEYVGSVGGIAGVLAIVLLWWCKQLITQMKADRDYSETKHQNLIQDYNDAMTERNKVMIQSAQIQTELLTWLKARNGNKL